jgi:hypothetical protein
VVTSTYEIKMKRVSLNTKDVIAIGSKRLKEMAGHTFNILSVTKPSSIDFAIDLTKITSKLSPLVGNLLEFNTVDFLNKYPDFEKFGRWKRQDPGFPDTIFEGSVIPTPGFEIKAWFPLATEITARFKDSQNHFLEDQTYVALIAWLPEFVIYGEPKIIDILIVSADSVAKARDTHYHNPPGYLVLEPENTSDRTSNLQQTNTNGYKIQEKEVKLKEAIEYIQAHDINFSEYSHTESFQENIRELFQRYKYRLDTNYAKMDRIGHAEINAFNKKILNTEFQGLKIKEWKKLFIPIEIKEKDSQKAKTNKIKEEQVRLEKLTEIFKSNLKIV